VFLKYPSSGSLKVERVESHIIVKIGQFNRNKNDSGNCHGLGGTLWTQIRSFLTILIVKIIVK
jgi:hypothetical protein